MNRLQYILSLMAVSLLLFSSCQKEEKEMILNGLEISPRQLTIVKGENSALEITFTPADIADKTVFWESSDTEVATIDADGNVTAVNPGTAVITAISNGVMAVCDVNVVKSLPTGIELDATSLKLFAKEFYTLKVTAAPQDADLSTLTWNSSAPEVASVDANGKILGVSDGTAVITAKVGEVKAECEIKVVTKAQIGDFFYSDGTWSTQLDASKTVVGVVFWSGDATSDDPMLAAAHPECTNGLAVALTEMEAKFNENYQEYCNNTNNEFIQDWADVNMPDHKKINSGLARGENGNFILGYNNTEVLLGFNADPANAQWTVEPAKQLLDYRKSNPLPGNTSDWYLPSIKEVFMLCDGYTEDNIFWVGRPMGNISTVNNTLSKIDGGVQLGQGQDHEYWSSTEHCMPMKQYYLDFKYQFSTGSQSKMSSNTVRFVFAF